MFRFARLSFVGISLFAIMPITNGNPPDELDNRFHKDLHVQNAMTRAQLLLIEKNAQKAVEVLEEQLPNVNGNPKYLHQLREAYRSYVMDLALTSQPELAKRYFDRLCILDPSAINDPAFRPKVDSAPRKFEVEPVKQSVLQFPNFKMPGLVNPFAKKEFAKDAPIVKPSVVRAHSEDSASIDPFEPKYQRDTPAVSSAVRPQPAMTREFLSKGEVEFKRERYAEARMYFEQAYQADQGSLEACRVQWAYCIIKGVADTMEQPGVMPGKRLELKKQVESAIGMAPTHLLATGQTLLQRLDERANAANVVVKAMTVKHWGSQNKEGWHVAETQHFLIFHRLDKDQAENIAQIAENTRSTMYRKWFEIDGQDWQPQCEVILHPNVSSYTQMTGVPNNSPGHSRIESDPSGRVVARRVDLRHDIATMAEAVLPHETTHVVLAGMFGNAPVPRWADEGIAVLSEPNEKIDLHRRNLPKHHKDGLLFGLKELMELKDYPHPRQIGAFYAQSVVLVEFLVQMRGPKTLTDFVRDAARQGYDAALQRHYNLTFTQLDQAWQQQVINNPERFAAQK